MRVSAGEPGIGLARTVPAGILRAVKVDVTPAKTGKGLTSIKIRVGLFGGETRAIAVLERIKGGICRTRGPARCGIAMQPGGADT